MPQETVINQSEIPSRSESAQVLPQNPVDDGEIDVIEVAELLWCEKKTILKFILVVTALTASVVFLIMRPLYTAEAVFLPPQSSPGSNMAQLASQLGSLGAMGTLSGLKSSGDVYLGILGSRTIADNLIQRFDLQQIYKTKRISDTVKKLEKRSSFTSGKDTLITINVEDHDPKRAADIANGYLDALREQNGRLALTDAAQRRLFFQEQLEREKNALADAEVEMKKTQERTGLIVPNGQAQVEIQAIAETRAQIVNRQVELAAIRQGATDSNPQVVRLQTQITGLELQLQKMQNGKGPRQPGSVQLSTAKVPEYALEYVRKQREVKYHEMLFELIAKQYENARLDESREAPLLQVIDRAVVPDKPSSLPRALVIFGGCLVGAFSGCAWIILRRFWNRLPRNQTKAAAL